MTKSIDALKIEAGIRACEYVKSGMKIGLGTGSTVRHSIIEIGRMIAEEGLEIIGVPTSIDTEILANQYNIPLAELGDLGGLDLVIDGADEFDPNLNLIKGGGGALLREKIVAQSSIDMVVVADQRKEVNILGEFPLPVEIVPFSWKETKRQIQKICKGDVNIRMNDEEIFVTDNGNYILDCEFGDTISDPPEIERSLQALAGVAECGLFCGICNHVILATDSGIKVINK